MWIPNVNIQNPYKTSLFKQIGLCELFTPRFWRAYDFWYELYVAVSW
jgi:hypothetical protein